MDDAHSTTGVLKKASPFWWWVRGNPMQILTLLGLLLAGVRAWHDLKSRVGNIETKVDEIAKSPPAVTNEQFSQLNSAFEQLRSEVDRQKGRWEQVDSVPELRSHRARH